MPGYGMGPEQWLGARVLLAVLPLTGFKPKCRVRSPRLQMQTAIFWMHSYKFGFHPLSTRAKTRDGAGLCYAQRGC